MELMERSLTVADALAAAHKDRARLNARHTQTAEMDIAITVFSEEMLYNGLPRYGLNLRVADDVFGDHVYTVIQASQTDPRAFHLLCLVDSFNRQTE